MRTSWEPDAALAFERSQSWIERTRKLCRERGVEILLLIIPTPLQSHDPTWALAVEHCGIDPTQFDREKPSRMLREWAVAEDLDVLDLLPILRERFDADPTWSPYQDVHFNRDGHRFAAEALALRGRY